MSDEQSFEVAITQLVRLARTSEPLGNSAIDAIVEDYLSGFSGNKRLERERLGNAYDQRFSRKSERATKIYQRIKGID